MRILFDYQVFTFHKYGAIARYFCEIIARIRTNASVFLGNVLFRNFCFSEMNIKSCAFEELVEQFLASRKRMRRILVSMWLRVVWVVNGAVYVLMLLRRSYDVVHITYDIDTWPARLLRKTPFVYTVHDLIHELFNSPSRAYLEKRKWLARHAARVIAVSENTKADIVRLQPFHRPQRAQGADEGGRRRADHTA